MVTLNENHKRRLVATFKHLDQLLVDAENIMASSRSRSVFPQYVADLTPVQGKVLADYFARFRDTMLRRLPELGIEAPVAPVSMLRALRVHMIHAEIALEDTSGSAMRGYGALTPEDIQAIERVVAELHGQLERISAFLDETPDKDVHARIERLAGTADETRLLAELERVITAHGLVEQRLALGTLVDRIESRRFEVAVFGRVSSGKSSLLNHLLRREVLPVGVTPITAIPTRLAFGAKEQVTVEFAEKTTRTLPLADLATVATEQQNPGNSLHVTRIRVELPEPRLESGVTFVDTPGLGSLATAGAEETLAYLPRCDLGIVLIDAAAGVSPEALAVVRSLYRAGATAQLLLSKADLITPAEREQVAAYVTRSVETECGVRVPVFPVSVVGPAAALADAWLEDELLPLCRRQEDLAREALRRKVGALRDAVVASLRHRLERRQSAPARVEATHNSAADRIVAHTAALPEATRHSCEEQALRLSTLAEAVIAEAAVEIALRWRSPERHESVARQAVEASLRRHAGAVGAEVAAALGGFRDELSKALNAIRELTPLPVSESELPRVAGLPVIDAAGLSRNIVLGRSAMPLLGRRVLQRWLVSVLRRQLAADLEDVLQFHRRRLVAWSREIVTDVERAFEAEIGALRGGLTLPADAGPTPTTDEPGLLERDLEALEKWGDAPVASRGED